jgi:16S rRNA (guanine966-N2)-methyltransferase
MRIVGGTFKGRQFHPGKSFRSRPTTDFGKEGLFDILENSINWDETAALDLFSGTGSISFELISRGCGHVTAVENDFVHCRFIRETAATLGINNLNVIKTDVFRFMLGKPGAWDLVFADPPYTMKDFGSIAGKILASGIVKEGGLFILEHSKENSFKELPEFLELRKYGRVHFSFFRPKMIVADLTSPPAPLHPEEGDATE